MAKISKQGPTYTPLERETIEGDYPRRVSGSKGDDLSDGNSTARSQEPTVKENDSQSPSHPSPAPVVSRSSPSQMEGDSSAPSMAGSGQRTVRQPSDRVTPAKMARKKRTNNDL